MKTSVGGACLQPVKIDSYLPLFPGCKLQSGTNIL